MNVPHHKREQFHMGYRQTIKVSGSSDDLSDKGFRDDA